MKPQSLPNITVSDGYILIEDDQGRRTTYRTEEPVKIALFNDGTLQLHAAGVSVDTRLTKDRALDLAQLLLHFVRHGPNLPALQWPEAEQ